MRLEWEPLPRGSIVVPFRGSYLESRKVIPKRNYYGAYGHRWNTVPSRVPLKVFARAYIAAGPEGDGLHKYSDPCSLSRNYGTCM